MIEDELRLIISIARFSPFREDLFSDADWLCYSAWFTLRLNNRLNKSFLH